MFFRLASRGCGRAPNARVELRPVIIAQQVGRYFLLDRIAVGGMAEIYRALTFDSQGHNHMVAIKRVLSNLADDDDFLQMMVDEAKITILLNHANVARVYEFVRVGDDYFIAMEYVDGRDIRAILERLREDNAWLPPEHAAYIVMCALHALHATHEARDGTGEFMEIVHRDVSPSNVLVGYDARVKLCDFGIAKAKLSRIQTRHGVIKGKVKYMSPEQAMGRKVDRRSDIFSAGTVLYELLTRQPPFTAEGEMDLIMKVRDARFTKPSKVNQRIPAQLDRIIRKAMNRSLGGRYQTAQEFAEALRMFIHEHCPDYTPATLGQLLRVMFKRDIDKDLRLLEQFVLGESDPDNLGDNLLAEVLGEGAPYTQFVPVHPRKETTGMVVTRMTPHVPSPEERIPPGANLHRLRTMILDPEERDAWVRVRKKRPRPGADYRAEAKTDTGRGTGELRADDDATDPDAVAPMDGTLDRHFHSQPTRIIKIGADDTDENEIDEEPTEAEN